MNNSEYFNVFLSKKERIKTIFQTNDFADCVFVIDGQEIKAHKLILTLSSPVFEKMFFGHLSSSRIEIKDISVDDFKQMLDFVYNDHVRIDSVAKAWNLFYIAQKYIMHDLGDVCSTFIEKNLNITNLVLNYEYSDMFGIEQLKSKCMGDISDYIRGIFQLYSDYHMKPTTLVAILSQSSLNIDETELVKRVLDWAVIECDINKKVFPFPETVVDLLKSLDILKFLVNLEFSTEIVANKVIVDSMKAIKAMKNPEVLFHKYAVKHWCSVCKSRQIYKIAKRVNTRGLEGLHSHVSVNQNVLLFGIVVISEDEKLGASSSEYNGTIKIEIVDAEAPYAPIQVTMLSKTFPYCAPVYIPLSELVVLNALKNYSIKIFYTNFDSDSSGRCISSSVLCQYMSSKLIDEKKKTIFVFDELEGSVIKGLCYYPA